MAFSTSVYHRFGNLQWSKIGLTSYDHPQNVPCWHFIHYIRPSNLDVNAAEKHVLDFLKNFGQNLKADLPDGTTRLHWLALLPFIQLADYWMQYLDADVPDMNGYTPLYIAASIGNVPMYNFLIMRDANPEKMQPNNLTPSEVFNLVCKAQNINQTKITPVNLTETSRKRMLESEGGDSANKRLKLNLHTLDQSQPTTTTPNQSPRTFSPTPSMSPISSSFYALKVGSPLNFASAPAQTNVMPSPRKGTELTSSPRKEGQSSPHLLGTLPKHPSSQPTARKLEFIVNPPSPKKDSIRVAPEPVSQEIKTEHITSPEPESSSINKNKNVE